MTHDRQNNTSEIVHGGSDSRTYGNTGVDIRVAAKKPKTNQHKHTQKRCRKISCTKTKFVFSLVSLLTWYCRRYQQEPPQPNVKKNKRVRKKTRSPT